MKVWIDGELHYLGTMRDRQEAADYVRFVESRYPNRLRRPRGSIHLQRRPNRRDKWIAVGPRPERKPLGRFDTRWAAEQQLKRLGIR